jgi:uncharacterized protein (TIGR00645 family)
MANKISQTRKSYLKKLEDFIEVLLFRSRWLLAPMYIGLVISLGLIVFKFIQYFIQNLSTFIEQDIHEAELSVLGLLDLTLIGNLILIVIFAGYENFVSRMDLAAKSPDRPHWMGRVDYSGLKIKLIGSLVAISVIELLADFMQANRELNVEALKWRIAIHLTFVVSGVLFAVMDLIADKRAAVDFELDRKIKKNTK